MGRRRGAVLGATLLAGSIMTVGAPPLVGTATAAGPDCTFTFDLLLAPGIGADPSSGSLRTDGKSGKFNCRGYKGDAGFDGMYGTGGPVTCPSGGEGAGKLTYRFGFNDQEDDIRFTFGAIEDGKMSGAFGGGSYEGKYTFTATEGNCVSGPVTRGKLVGEVSRK